MVDSTNDPLVWGPLRFAPINSNSRWVKLSFGKQARLRAVATSVSLQTRIYGTDSDIGFVPLFSIYSKENIYSNLQLQEVFVINHFQVLTIEPTLGYFSTYNNESIWLFTERATMGEFATGI